jgi:hypothetical protein
MLRIGGEPSASVIFQMEGIHFVNGNGRFALEVSLRLERFLPALCESRALRTPLIILVNKYPISSILLQKESQ